MNSAVKIRDLSFRYGERVALDGIDLEIYEAEIFGLLGPNGSGKTTLFRLLSTLLNSQVGEIQFFGAPHTNQIQTLRGKMGVVFQAPSLDKKLTVRENIRYGAILYGLRGNELDSREAQVLQQLGIADRKNDIVETLSGGLRRRVELAKAIIHQPALLLLDEPSTGLDPNARSDLWNYLLKLRQEDGVTIVFTTHLLDEAEHADRIGIFNEGQLVALGKPEELRSSVGGSTLTIETQYPKDLSQRIQEEFQCTSNVVGNHIRLEHSEAAKLIGPLVDAFGEQIMSVKLGKPTLEDVFISRTGHRFWDSSMETN